MPIEGRGEVGYCEGCGKRITGDDFSMGDAVRSGERIYCLDCSKLVAGDTSFMPASAMQNKQSSTRPKAPSTRSLPAPRHRSSRKASSSTKLATQLRSATVQKIAASLVCPYCGEKLVVVITALPCNHTCELCGKIMRVPAPG